MKTTTNATDKKKRRIWRKQEYKTENVLKRMVKSGFPSPTPIHRSNVFSLFILLCVCMCWCLYMYFVCLRVYIWTGTLNQESNSSQNWLQCYKVLVISLFLLLLLLLSWSVCCASDILMTIIFNDINSENFMIQFHNNTHHH